MAQELERLIVKLDADLRSYEKALATAQNSTITKMRAMEKEAQVRTTGIERAMARAGAGIARFGNSFKEIGAGLLAGFTAKAFIDAIAGAVDKLAELGEIAGRIGITTDALQSLQRIAVLTGASVDQMHKALQSIAEQSAESGSFLEKLFTANGVKLSKDMTTNVQNFMNILHSFGSEQDRLLIMTKVTGDKVGRNLVEAFSKGGDEVKLVLDDLIAKGEHHSEAQIKEMQEIRAKYFLYMDDISQLWASVIVGLIEKSGEWFTFQKANLNQMIKDLSTLGKVIAGISFQGPGTGLDSLVQRQADLVKQLAETPANTRFSFSLQQDLNTVNKQIAALQQRNQVIEQAPNVLQHHPAPRAAAAAAPGIMPLTPEQIAAEKSAQAERERALKEELDKKKRAYAETEQTINDLMVQSQKDRAEAELAALQATIDKMDEVRSTAEDMFKGVLQGIRDGESAGEILNNILTKIEDKLFDLSSTGFTDVLFGKAGTAGPGLLGGLLPKFAHGGITNGLSIAGEKGAEAVVPLPDGRSIPVDVRMPRNGGLPPMNVKIENHGGAQVSTSMGRGSSGPELRVMIRSAVGEDLATGRHDKALGGRFNLTPASRRRT